METLIGGGQSLVTPVDRVPFQLHSSDYGLVFDVSTGNPRRTPGHGPKKRAYGAVEFYADWLAAGRPSSAWITKRMKETGVGTAHASYILPALRFFHEHASG
jgi:hypothetical protein